MKASSFVPAKVRDEAWCKFCHALISMGLAGQEIRVAPINDHQVIVSPDDLTNGRREITLRRDIIELL